MAGYSLFQIGTTVLVVVAVLEALVYLWNRAKERSESMRGRVRHDLDAGRRLIGLAEERVAAKNDEAALRICDRARVILSEVRRRAAESGDGRLESSAKNELARCAAITEHSMRRFKEGRDRRHRAADGRLDAGRLEFLERMLDEVETVLVAAEEAFAAGNFIDARDIYRSVRARLDEARRMAVQAGSRSYVKLIDEELARAQRGLASSNAWVLDGRPVIGGGGRNQVKGVIAPNFKREDGSFEPRPR
jgi:hypothetical protein